MRTNYLGLNQLSLTIGGVDILRNLQAELPVNGRTMLLGPNGSGKSSLLAMIQGLIEPTVGRVEYPDADAPSAAFHENSTVKQARLFATVFQKPVMLRRSALANVCHALACADVPRAHRQEKAMQALRGVGLEYVAKRPARSLSGGEQQRLAIARASALDPVCLLCDEPTASLDPGAAAEVERLLTEFCVGGKGVFMATHDLGQARRLADYVVFMHRGQIRGHGPARAFFTAPPDPVAARFLRGELVGDCHE